MNKLYLAVLLCFASVAIQSTGCGSSGSDPRGNHIKGSVTFKGGPVPAGTIQFIPKGDNSGPPGNAAIVNGSFDTADKGGNGTVGGPHSVIINGFDGDAKPDEELPFGEPVFGDYQVDFDVPKGKESAPQNFDVVPHGV